MSGTVAASSWTSMKTRITASVRTTNRMNALLSESMLSRRRALQNGGEGEGPVGEGGERKEKPKNDWKFFHTNFNMERAHKIIEDCIEERLLWDRFSRSYDSWRAVQLVEGLSAEIRDRVKKLNHRRHRIVCLLSLVEKQNQGIYQRMCHLMDEKRDNFTQLVFERPTYFMIVVLYLVYKD
ncbi:dynein light chain Tctex-type protein 2B isoform X1 [Drosophila nasuta]|uniref:Dynein light chain Tctex-type protein 2B isoform X1 n=1 Tax=Drosophila albomicans TaxID=7291 RepID=A0A6P8YIV2_DROAB|nr:dynein light chain Tctex-type protein 2B isoform X1 [Drosophila albomicans]XP_060655983.1 dynein light chain Tctex-type protein 2B isoform X1 [Drosophila nasuta]